MLSKLTKNFKSKVSGGKAGTTANCKRDHFKRAFKTGNIIQLFSRMTGNTLHVTVDNTLDALGPKDVDAADTLWTVTVVDEHTLQLYQEESYLSIIDGEATLTKKDESIEESTKLQINFHEQFVLLSAANNSGHHIGMLENGQLKSAIATGTENNSHFAVKIIFSPSPETTEKKEEETADELEGEKDVANGEATEAKDDEVVENGDVVNEAEAKDVSKSEVDIKEETTTEIVNEEATKDETAEAAS